MKKLKTPFLFSIAVLPIAVIAGILAILYQIDLYPAEVLEQVLAQLGSTSTDVLIVVGGIQTAVYAFLCSFFGCMLARQLGLWRSLKIAKKPLALTLGLSLVFGIVFSLDYWVFGNIYPAIQESISVGLTPVGFAASVLYGGIIEELMIRLLFMSLIAFILWKLFCRKAVTGEIPAWVYVAANVIAALIFAAGHLPSTVSTFGAVTPLLLFRCFLLNGGFGLYFGWLYRKFGIQYAMIAHASMHIVSKLIWIMF